MDRDSDQGEGGRERERERERETESRAHRQSRPQMFNVRAAHLISPLKWPSNW